MPSDSFQSILDAALADYSKQVGIDLATHPLSNSVRSCGSPNDILKLLEDKAKEFRDFREGNRRLINWLGPVVHVVYTLSAVLGASLTLVSRNTSFFPSPFLYQFCDQIPFKPANAVFAGVGILVTVRLLASFPAACFIISGCYRRRVASVQATMRSSTCLNASEISSNEFASTAIFP